MGLILTVLRLISSSGKETQDIAPAQVLPSKSEAVKSTLVDTSFRKEVDVSSQRVRRIGLRKRVAAIVSALTSVHKLNGLGRKSYEVAGQEVKHRKASELTGSDLRHSPLGPPAVSLSADHKSVGPISELSPDSPPVELYSPPPEDACDVDGGGKYSTAEKSSRRGARRGRTSPNRLTPGPPIAELPGDDCHFDTPGMGPVRSSLRSHSSLSAAHTASIRASHKMDCQNISNGNWDYPGSNEAMLHTAPSLNVSVTDCHPGLIDSSPHTDSIKSSPTSPETPNTISNAHTVIRQPNLFSSVDPYLCGGIIWQEHQRQSGVYDFPGPLQSFHHIDSYGSKTFPPMCGTQVFTIPEYMMPDNWMENITEDLNARVAPHDTVSQSFPQDSGFSMSPSTTH